MFQSTAVNLIVSIIEEHDTVNTLDVRNVPREQLVSVLLMEVEGG